MRRRLAAWHSAHAPDANLRCPPWRTGSYVTRSDTNSGCSCKFWMTSASSLVASCRHPPTHIGARFEIGWKAALSELIGLAKETHHRAALSSRASEHSPRRKLREYDLPSRQQQHLEKSSAGGIVRSTGGIT